MAAKKEKRPCKAIARQTGKPCRRPAEPGSDYCIFHGGGNQNAKGHGRPKGTPKSPNAGGPAWGNLNNLRHGAYSARLKPEALALFESIFDEYMADVVNPSATDRKALQRLAILEAKWQMAVTGNDEVPAEAVETIHRLLHRELKTLQVTRESKDSRSTGTTPAEVIAAIMMRVQERRTLMSTKRIAATDDDEQVIDAEFEETPVQADEPADDQVDAPPDDDQADDQAVEAQVDGDEMLSWWQ